MASNHWREDVEAAREAEGTRRQAQIEGDLQQIRDLEVWLRQVVSLPPDLRAHLEAEKLAASLRVAERLTSWLALGGQLVLLPSTTTAHAEPPREVAPREVMPREVMPREVPSAPMEATAAPTPPPPPRVVPPQPRVAEPVVRLPEEPRVAASVEALASLKQRLESGAAFDESAVASWTARLEQVVPPLLDALDDDHEVNRLRAAVGVCDTWAVFPHDIQRMLIGLSATRLRMLQDERGVESRRLDALFSQLTAYSARERPGAVHGLARGHRPFRDTWREDAEAWADRLRALVAADDEAPSPSAQRVVEGLERLAREIPTAPTPETQAAVRSQLVREVGAALRNGLSPRNRALVKLLTPHADAFGAADFRGLRRAIRDEAEAAEEESGAGERSAIPEEWPWWTRTKGRHAVMVGGSPRELNRARLEQTFQFTSLEWEGTEFKRNSLQALRNRIASGGIDLVLILRSFVGHDADQILLPACRERGVDWVHVEQGYGTARVRAAIERFLDP